MPIRIEVDEEDLRRALVRLGQENETPSRARPAKKPAKPKKKPARKSRLWRSIYRWRWTMLKGIAAIVLGLVVYVVLGTHFAASHRVALTFATDTIGWFGWWSWRGLAAMATMATVRHHL